MLLSRDGTKVFVAVPKTGTNSARAILNQYCDPYEVYRIPRGEQGGVHWGEFIRTYHRTVEENLPYIRERFPNATVNSLKAYAFWRDPVERWCSGVNFYYKRTPMFLCGLNTVASNPKKMQMLDAVIHRFHEDQCKNPAYGNSPEIISNPGGLKEVREFYSPEVVEEMANVPWEGFPVDLDEAEFFYPQANWLTQPNTVILDYSKFDEEMEWLVNREWVGKLYYDKSNTTYRNKSEVKKLPVSKSMRKKIMEAYSMDYDLTPHTIS